MSFLYPQVLYALFAVSIPIVIHLFNLRKHKKIYFSNVHLLSEIKQQSKRKTELKHLLVLMARILTISAMVFAFAQPIIRTDNHDVVKGKQAVVVFIDNSFSMSAESEYGQLLEYAKQLSTSIVEGFNYETEFYLLSNEFSSKQLFRIDKEQMLSEILNIDFSATNRDIGLVVDRMKQQAENTVAAKVNYFIISDFQEYLFTENDLELDSAADYYFVPLKPTENKNVFIDSVWVNSPILQSGQTIRLSARIKNSGNKAIENLPVKFYINDKLVSPGNLQIPANSHAIADFNYLAATSGLYSGSLKIDDFPMVFDDAFYFGFRIKEAIPVLCINQTIESKYFNSLFGKDSLFTFLNVLQKNVDFSDIRAFDLIILNELEELSDALIKELHTYIAEGGSVVIVPPENINYSLYKTMLHPISAAHYGYLDTTYYDIYTIKFSHPLFNDVFESIPKNINLPFVRKHYRIQNPPSSISDNLLTLSNGDSFLSQIYYKQGNLFLFSSWFNNVNTNFTEHAIFVPILLRMAFMASSESELYRILGKDNSIRVQNKDLTKDMVYKITDRKGFEMIPMLKVSDFTAQLFYNDYINAAGNYFVESAGKEIQVLSLNYRRDESETKYKSDADIERLLHSSGYRNFSMLNEFKNGIDEQIQLIKNGVSLWKWFVLIALVFMAIEIAILRFFR